NEVEILKFTQPGPEVIAIEHRPHVRMSGFSRHLQRGGQRSDEGGTPHELEHSRNAQRFDNLPRLAQVLHALDIVVTCKFFGCAAWADYAVDPQFSRESRSVLELVNRLNTSRVRFGQSTD